MRIQPLLLALALGAPVASAQAATPHRCAADAVVQAKKLLLFHSNNDDRAEVDSASVKAVGTVKALSGKGRFDVLDVTGFVYKGEYRLRMIYAQLPGDCVLMGQEVLEYSDPY